MRIAERIWAAWNKQVERGNEPSLRLLLVPAADRPDLTEALRDSLFEVQRKRSDSSWTGEWDWVRVSDGVLVQVTDCDEFDTVLRCVAAALARRDVEGSFDLHVDAATAALPRSAHMVECRVRVRGTRVRQGSEAYLWQADPAAHEALLACAERWCRRDRAAESLNVSTVGPVAVEPAEDVLEAMNEAVRDRMQVELWSVTSHEFRSVAARAWTGGVSLVQGGAWIEGGHWRRPLAELTDLLSDQADRVAYGFVRRGWAVSEALLENELPIDWPLRADRAPRGIGFTREAFEDVLAPDAFGVQLLGPGYAGRVPDLPAWRQVRAGTASVMLEHVDLAAWFDAPFVRDRENRQPPELLARAREELAPILYSTDAFEAMGYASESG